MSNIPEQVFPSCYKDFDETVKKNQLKFYNATC